MGNSIGPKRVKDNQCEYIPSKRIANKCVNEKMRTNEKLISIWISVILVKAEKYNVMLKRFKSA